MFCFPVGPAPVNCTVYLQQYYSNTVSSSTCFLGCTCPTYADPAHSLTAAGKGRYGAYAVVWPFGSCFVPGTRTWYLSVGDFVPFSRSLRDPKPRLPRPTLFPQLLLVVVSPEALLVRCHTTDGEHTAIDSHHAHHSEATPRGAHEPLASIARELGGRGIGTKRQASNFCII